MVVPLCLNKLWSTMQIPWYINIWIFFSLRSWFSVYCLSKSSVAHAFSAAVGSTVLSHASGVGIGQSGEAPPTYLWQILLYMLNTYLTIYIILLTILYNTSICLYICSSWLNYNPFNKECSEKPQESYLKSSKTSNYTKMSLSEPYLELLLRK